ncbi:hypothetical protein JJC03_09340 [Flavobacterium oreochromis]|uniref:helix-turn-helix domain-containing protein n=1 Tax=Flavobacterium oreochromis TaxID=2906078 RepID=UPI001CE6F856|nr:helix-turn-helix domain-containing protein [Flavobacterium oreochromis]QYS85441.1 hypothetical protein JJC03_09340 [Flavobacterium oreochromis]
MEKQDAQQKYKISWIDYKPGSQEHFDMCNPFFSYQCRVVYQALLRGEKITTSTALIKYKVGDLRRRVKDLKDMWGVPVLSEYTKTRYKIYFLNINPK